MKKFFTLTVAFVLSFSAYAQTSVFQRDLNKRGYAKLTTTQASTTNKVVANKIEPTANKYGGDINQKTKNVVLLVFLKKRHTMLLFLWIQAIL